MQLFRLFDFLATKFEKLFRLTIFVLIFFAAASGAKATNSIDINNLQLVGQYDTGWVNAMQGFRPTTNNLSGFSLWSDVGNVQTMTADLFICKGTTTQNILIYHSRSTSTEAEYGCGSTTLVAKYASTTFNDTVASGAGNYATTTVFFPSPLNMEIGKDYYFVLHYISGQRNLKPSLNYNTYLATDTEKFFFNTWWNGQQRQTDNSGGTGGVDMPFATWYNYELNAAKITIIEPVDAQRVYDNMPLTIKWSIYNPGLAYNGGFIKILNKSTWTALQDITFDVSTTSATAQIDLPFSDFEKANYRIYGNLYNSATGQMSSTSNIVDFVVGSDTIYLGKGDQQYMTGSQLSEQQLCAGIATSTFFGGIECGFKKVIAWAIVPNEDTVSRLKYSYSEFKTVFPFNAYFQVTDTVQQAIASSSVNRNGTFDVPFYNGQTKQFYTMPVLSSTSLSKAVGNTNANLIRNTITWIFWALAAFLVFIQIKKI